MQLNKYLEENRLLLHKVCALFYKKYYDECNLVSSDNETLFSDVVLVNLPRYLYNYNETLNTSLNNFVTHCLVKDLGKYIERELKRKKTILENSTDSGLQEQDLCRINIERAEGIEDPIHRFVVQKKILGYTYREIVRLVEKEFNYLFTPMALHKIFRKYDTLLLWSTTENC